MVLLRSKINWYLSVYIHLKPHNVTAGLTYVCAEFLTETETSTLEVPLPLPQHTISFPFSVQRMKKCTAIIIYSEFNRWMDSVKCLNLAGFFGMAFLPHTVPLPTPHPPQKIEKSCMKPCGVYRLPARDVSSKDCLVVETTDPFLLSCVYSLDNYQLTT